MAPRPQPSRFRPPWWLRGPHAQTIVGRYLRHARGPATVRERVQTPDGDFLDLERTAALGDDTRAVVVVLHGLEGCSRSGYVRQTLGEIVAAGMTGVALNFRSCGGEMNRTARFYHAGETGDLELVLAILRRRAPNAALGAVGFSLGGNVLLKFLGQRGDAARHELAAAAAVSVPFDLAAGAKSLERGFARVYTRYFMRKLLRKAEQKAALTGNRCDADRVRRARTLREFDDASTAPLHGFRDAHHYYRESSSARYLAGIRVPTLLVQALDDPFLPAEAVPLAAIQANPALFAELATGGGHVGFVEGAPWAPRFWAEREAVRFVRARLLPSTS